MTTAGKLTYVVRMLLEIERLTDNQEIRELAGNGVHTARELLLEETSRTKYDWKEPLAGLAGLEPAAICLEGKRSIHLSYSPEQLDSIKSQPMALPCRVCGEEIVRTNDDPIAERWLDSTGSAGSHDVVTHYHVPDRRVQSLGAPNGVERRNRVDSAIDEAEAAVDRVMGSQKLRVETSAGGAA